MTRMLTFAVGSLSLILVVMERRRQSISCNTISSGMVLWLSFVGKVHPYLLPDPWSDEEAGTWT
jgi:hypothetical protein